MTVETENLNHSSDDVVEVVSRLIRFDTTNTGEPETTQGEAECAQWVAEQLAEVGYQPRIPRIRGARAAAMCSPASRARTARVAHC